MLHKIQIGLLKKFNPKIIKNFGWALLGRLLAALLQTVGIVLLARWETVSNFGIVISVLALAIVAHSLIDFGLTTYLIKERAAKIREHLYSCFIYNKRIASFSALLIVGIFSALGVLVDAYYFYLVPIGIWIAFERQSDLLIGFFIADGNNKLATTLLTHRRLVALLLFLFLYYIGLQATLAYSLGISIAALFSYIQVRRLLTEEISLLDKALVNFNEVFKKSFPFWINSFFAQLRNVDVVIVTLIIGPAMGALFGAVNRLVSPLSMVSSSMAMVILPSVSKSEIASHEYYKYTFLATALSSIPYVMLFFLAEYIVNLTLGEKYRGVIPLLEIISIGLILFSASSVLGSIMQGAGLQERVAQVNIIVTLMYIAILVPFAYYGGVLYATYALCIFFLLRLMMMVIF